MSAVLGAPVNAVDALMADVNHDSRPDLIVLTKSAVTLRLQNADGTFAKPKTILKVQGGVALAVGDVNGDNNPDIYVVCGRTGDANAPDYLLIGNAKGGFTTQGSRRQPPARAKGIPDRLQPLRPHQLPRPQRCGPKHRPGPAPHPPALDIGHAESPAAGQSRWASE